MEDKVRTYNVGKSRCVRYVTLGTWLVVIVVCISVIAKSFGDITNFYVSIPFVLLLLSIMLYYFFISPMRVELTDDALVLHRVLGRRVFRFADIAEAGKWDEDPVGLLRICGSGAFCGYIGWFSGGGLGRHFEYVGKYADAFYLKLRNGRTYLISCEDSAAVAGVVAAAVEKAAQSRPSSE